MGTALHDRPASPEPVVIEPLGDNAVDIKPRLPGVGDDRISRLRTIAVATRAANIPGVVDVIPSPDRVTVVYDPLAGESVEGLIAMLRERLANPATEPPRPAGSLDIPVRYGGEDGPDLDAVCRHHGIDRAAVIRLHSDTDYLVTAIGFVPGFPYLAGLSEQLATPRLATPRTCIPAGSVGIGGSQTGVYPFATPGGWQLIGRTSLRLFDPAATQPALLAMGDRVRFREVADLPEISAGPPAATEQRRPPQLTILEPGLLTTVQDLGRPRYRSSGVPSGGAADSMSARLANLVVGNPETAAVLEFTLVGPRIRFETPSVVALAGSLFSGYPPLRPLVMQGGDVLALGHAEAGCRGYLAVAGGIEVPPVLGSRCTYLPANFGGFSGRPLQPGDRLAAGKPAHLPRGRHWSLAPDLLPLPPRAGSCCIRFIPAADQPTGAAAFSSRSFRVTARSDRMGLRLSGSLSPCQSDGISRAVLPGAIQLPPDGNPILLLADAQTIGGYAVLGQVITADLPLAGQLRPGSTVRFEPTTIATAHRLLRQQHELLATVRDGVAAQFRSAEKPTP